MTAAEVESYLHEHIPLSAEIAARVVEVSDERVVLEAPLEPNLNHRSTAFGGSVSALAILAGWTAVHFRLRAEGHRGHTVIQESSVRYDAPIHDSFRAVAIPADETAWARFTRALFKRGKGRVRIRVTVESEGIEAASFLGSYVALAEEV